MKQLLLTLLVGCTSMAPKYERPASPVPQQLGTGTGNFANVPWKQFIKEPKLQQVIELGLVQSRDLRRAAINIEAARSLYRIQRAAMLPSIDAGAYVSSQRIIVAPDTKTATSTQYGVQVGLASWEIDLFGRLKSLSDAKLQQYFSLIETAKATRISLVGEISTAWVTMAADKSRLQIALDTVESSKKTMELTDALVGGGTSNRGDYYQASTVYQQARADVALLTAAIAQDKNALDLLVGAQVPADLLPDALPDGLDWFADVPSGMSSAVLLERPDVAAAEHDLMAANANIGEARAEFFPRLSLTANAGLASLALGALFTGPAAVFSLAPSLGMPLFHGGAIRANLAYTEAQKLGLVAAYEQAIHRAFREVADQLATRSTIAEQLEAQHALLDDATKSFELAQERYKAGIDTFLTTLVSQRALYAAKNSLVSTQLSALSNQVALYRVLGGGLQ